MLSYRTLLFNFIGGPVPVRNFTRGALFNFGVLFLLVISSFEVQTSSLTLLPLISYFLPCTLKYLVSHVHFPRCSNFKEKSLL